VKFLADMGISARTIATLREQGHDAVHVREIGLDRASDATILEQARADGRVVLTVDLDFGQLLAANLQATPSVVIFRVHDQTPASITPRLLRVVAERSTDLEDGAIILVEDRRYRIRSLPIER
jgi:predicted nuclease of predicted toxin-antitoxin system